MRLTFFRSITFFIATAMLLAFASSTVALTKTAAYQLPGNIYSATLITHHDQLFALAFENGKVSVFKTEDGAKWKRIPLKRPKVKAFQGAPNTSMTDPIVFGEYTYIALNEEIKETSSQVYRVSTNGESEQWEKSGTKGFGGKYIVNDFFVLKPKSKTKARLYALTSSSSGVSLWRTKNGTEWKRVTKANMNVFDGSVTAAEKYKTDEGRFVFAGDTDGNVCRANVKKIAEWECVGQYGNYIHDLVSASGKLYMMAAINGADSVIVYSSDTGESFMSQDILEDTILFPRFNLLYNTVLMGIPTEKGVALYTLKKSGDNWKSKIQLKQANISNMVEFQGEYYMTGTTTPGSDYHTVIFRINR